MNSKTKQRAVLFDLDGTLIDQFDAIHRAFSKTLVSMGLDAPTYDQVKRAVGGATESTMIKLIGPERAKEAAQKHRPIFEKEMFNGLKVLPGVIQGIEKLKANQFKCAVLTNKFGPHARAACQHLEIDKYLEFTLGANDTPWKKPQKSFTDYALKKLQFSAHSTCYAGDSPYDYETARNADLACFLIASGTHSFDELKELNGEKTFKNFEELIDAIVG
jgi:phosphoglycolate phosphatase